MSEEFDPTGNSLFTRLGRNVADLSGNTMDPEIIVFVICSALDSYKTMNLDTLVKEAGKVL